MAPLQQIARSRTELTPNERDRGTTIASQPDFYQAISLGPLDGLVGYHLRRAFAALRSDFTRTFEGSGMRQVLFGILSVISANPGINQGNVARALGIQRPNMVALLNELVERGLVARTVDRQDRRAFLLKLTPSGKSTMTRVLTRIRVHEERMLHDLTSEERQTLIDLLERIEAKGD